MHFCNNFHPSVFNHNSLMLIRVSPLRKFSARLFLLAFVWFELEASTATIWRTGLVVLLKINSKRCYNTKTNLN